MVMATNTQIETVPQSLQRPCDHPAFEKELFHGAHTGDYLCTTCGECLCAAEVTRIEAERAAQAVASAN
jgi:hypothetical protein